MAILCRNFYTGNTVDIARSLIGCYLVRRYEDELLVCRITETEAYVGAIDKAAHSYGYHKTARNATMFGPPGHAYIYLIYGMHCCLNCLDLTTGDELFLCTSLSDAGLPDQPPRPFTIHTGKRIGIDYAQEAVDFPWRFYTTDL